MSSMIPFLPCQFKAGDSLSLAGWLRLPEGTWAGTGEIRKLIDEFRVGKLIGPVTVTLGPVVDVDDQKLTPITIEATPAQTATWPYAQCGIDVRLTDETGYVTHTKTIGLRVIAAITQP